MDIKEPFNILIQGLFFGSWPSSAIWAPILIPYIAASQKTWQGGLRSVLIFLLSRLSVFVLLGALSGAIGSPLVRFFLTTSFSFHAQVFGGTLAVLLGLLIAFGRNTDIPFCRFFEKYLIQDQTCGMILLGLLAGITPSSQFMGIMAEIALFANNVFTGAAYGFAFGAGTAVSPLLFLGALAPLLRRLISRS